MESTHETTGHAHSHGPPEDWNSEEYVAYWLKLQEERSAERRRQFVTIRALMPKQPEQEFSYLNLGPGGGELDAVLLEHFPGAQATLVDCSLPMLGAARKRLSAFDDRIEYVQANLSNSAWLGAVSGPFDFAVSTIAIHNLESAPRTRELYGEVLRLLGHGGMFLNLDYVRSARPSLSGIGAWAARDAEAGLSRRGGGGHLPGTLLEHLGWLTEAGFTGVDVFWKDMNIALLCGLRDHLHLPEEAHEHAADGHSHDADSGHTHAEHSHEGHSHEGHSH